MAILTRPDIIAAIRAGAIQIKAGRIPVEAESLHIGTNSVDLHLHAQLRVYSKIPLDAKKDNPSKEVFIPEEGIVLFPDRLYLARTVESTFTPCHVPKIEGRSSTGRLGMSIHQAAGMGDVGFSGTWTLGLTVVHPVRVYALMRIAQLCFYELSTQLEQTEQYTGRYQGQVEPTGGRGHIRDNKEDA